VKAGVSYAHRSSLSFALTLPGWYQKIILKFYCCEIPEPCFYNIDEEISFLDLRTPHVPKNGRNGNQGSEWAYFVLARSFLTGLNGAVFVMFFRIFVDWGYNREWAVLRAGKPACLNLFERWIVFSEGLG
jgi:hypothetical protein